jgi:hypothetical protein
MEPVKKAWISVGVFVIFVVVVAAIYLMAMGGLEGTRGTTAWPVINISAIGTGIWCGYVSTLKCRNCGVGFMVGAWGLGRRCRKCGQPL